jgi:hypothetical protein
MAGVATAIGAAAVVGAGASIYAANKGASATRSASNAAISEQQAGLKQQAELSQPYRDLGTSNIQTYQDLLTGGGGPNAGANIEKTLQNTPGYKATLDTGIESAKRASAAGGLNLSGNQLAGVEQFGGQLADSTYSQRLSELLQPIQLGQAAAAGQAANVGTAAANIGQIGINQGNTNAAISANEVAGITKAASGGVNQYLTYNTLQGLNNPGGGGNPTYNPGYGNIDPSSPAVTGIGGPVYGGAPIST